MPKKVKRGLYAFIASESLQRLIIWLYKPGVFLKVKSLNQPSFSLSLEEKNIIQITLWLIGGRFVRFEWYNNMK